ncbi:unnamed protein product [Haemonchus placei]|uniref:Uncharacterized protein n=1 Tax=Haemonchus placei TaxID=6290 RepID=A0A0N4WH81_HAEPC|nr:unnamed protein product [Haemonchus placei]
MADKDDGMGEEEVKQNDKHNWGAADLEKVIFSITSFLSNFIITEWEELKFTTVSSKHSRAQTLTSIEGMFFLCAVELSPPKSFNRSWIRNYGNGFHTALNYDHRSFVSIKRKQFGTLGGCIPCSRSV